MGGVVSAIGDAVSSIFGGGGNDDADAIREAAQQQADATRAAAQKQVDAANAAAEAAKQQAEQQTSATNAALQQSIQTQRAANLSSQAILNQQTVQNQAKEASQADDKPVELATPEPVKEDPRRKYRTGSSSPKTANTDTGIYIA